MNRESMLRKQSFEHLWSQIHSLYLLISESDVGLKQVFIAEGQSLKIKLTDLVGSSVYNTDKEETEDMLAKPGSRWASTKSSEYQSPRQA
jgi:hypothetical protein